MVAPWMQVVGVVDDVRDSGVGTEAGPALFVSYLQQNTPTARPTLVIRSKSRPAQLFPAVRRAIWSVDPTQTIDAMSPLDDLMVRTASQPRFAAIVGGLLGGSALLLVLAGIYAVTLHGVLRRTREIGVRAALGATSQGLTWTMMRQGLAPAAAGVAVGVLIAIPAARALDGILVDGLSVADAPVIAAVIVLILVATAVAAFIPARRALRISPMVAMRDAP
jgi:ABC-type antimicrobial peptide transport system permease subunit